MNNINILAFDQATALTGCAYYEGNVLKQYDLIDCRNKKNNNNVGALSMMKLICNKISELNPDIVLIEDTIFSTNAKVLKDLSRLQGAIIYFCYLNNIELKSYLPTQWRKILGMQKPGLKRNELKQLALDYVQTKFNIKVNEDIADAICIGCAYINELQEEQGDKKNGNQ